MWQVVRAFVNAALFVAVLFAGLFIAALIRVASDGYFGASAPTSGSRTDDLPVQQANDRPVRRPRSFKTLQPTEFGASYQPTLRAAIEYALPFMGDWDRGSGFDPALGSRLLLAWSKLHLSWQDVAIQVDTPHADAVSRPEQFRGTRTCFRGELELPKRSEASGGFVRLRRPRQPDVRVLLTYPSQEVPNIHDVRACGIFVGVGSGDDAVVVGMLDTATARGHRPPLPLPSDMAGVRPTAEPLDPNIQL